MSCVRTSNDCIKLKSLASAKSMTEGSCPGMRGKWVGLMVGDLKFSRCQSLSCERNCASCRPDVL